MNEAAEAAYAVFEESTRRLLELVRGTSYGLRVGAKRLGDLTAKGGPLASVARKSADEMRELVAALDHSEENLSEAAVVLLGAHFCRYLQQSLGLPARPQLPGTPEELEKLAGHPGALKKAGREFIVFLALHDAMLTCGCLDRAALDKLKARELELVHPGGKVKLYLEGDRVTLSEEWIESLVKAALDVARVLKSHRAGSVVH